MLSLYEILKASKTGIAPNMWTALAGKNWGGAGSVAEVKELIGIPPLSFRANGQPLIDYTIYGNMAQTGTPTPTTPILPSECGDLTGNLFDKDNVQPVTIYPSTPSIANSANAVSVVIPVEPNTTYTFSKTAGIRNRFCETVSIPSQGDTALNYVNADSSNSYTITTGNTTHYILWWIGYSQTYADIASTIMLNLGSTAIPYEPYGYKIPISSAGETTPVYLGDVETMRYVRKSVLDGTENWVVEKEGTENEYYAFTQTVSTVRQGFGMCTHYAYTAVTTGNTAEGIYVVQAGSVRVRDRSYSSVDDFKSFLTAQYAAGTPVTVWYVLATPETGVLNEPIRKIGNYADTLSMEQAGASIPTNNGSTTVDVETTVKPSEVYIKYKGV